jgi:hypothetical protein
MKAMSADVTNGAQTLSDSDRSSKGSRRRASRLGIGGAANADAGIRLAR